MQTRMEPKHIYSFIEESINNALNSLETISCQANVRDAHINAIKSLQALRKENLEKIKELEDNAIWDKFVIAFYGETNSGKSTIIEAFRIMLGEQTKIENRERFKDYVVENNLTPDFFDNNHEACLKNVETLEKYKNEWDNCYQADLEKKKHYEERIRWLDENIQTFLAGLNIVGKLKNFFVKTTEQKELQETKNKLAKFVKKLHRCNPPINIAKLA